MSVHLEPAAQASANGTANPPCLFDLGPETGRAAVDEVQNEPVTEPAVDITGLVAPGGRAERAAVRTYRDAMVDLPGPLHADRHRASSFGDDANQYDRARPRYPEALADFLVERGPKAVLDVGCGTGIATQLLLDRGCTVLGVEPDPRMAAVARGRGFEVEVAKFEDWADVGRRFDLLISAQAWHWVEPIAGAEKATAVVHPGGGVACFWNVGRPAPALRAALDACYQQLAPGIEEYSVLLGRGDSDRFTRCAESFAANDRLEGVTTTTYAHVVAYTTAEWLDHLETHSDHRTLPTSVKEPLFAELTALIDALGGGIELPYEVICVSAQRTED